MAERKTLPLTNKYGWPPALVAMIEQELARYDSGGSKLTASSIGDPVRAVTLRHRHGHEVQEDVSDKWFAFHGSIVHDILSKMAPFLPPDAILEKRFFGYSLGWEISGQVDVFTPSTGLLEDYKEVTVYSRKRGPRGEWLYQLNTLAELLRLNGYAVKELQAIRIYKDWTPSAKAREFDYPDSAVERVPIQMWSSAEAQAWIVKRTALHQAQEKTADADLPMCTDEERWNEGKVYAVMEGEKKKALKLFKESEHGDRAYAMAADMVAGGLHRQIQARTGEDRRCSLGYCNVREFCSYWQEKYAPKKEVANATV